MPRYYSAVADHRWVHLQRLGLKCSEFCMSCHGQPESTQGVHKVLKLKQAQKGMM